MSAIPSMCVVCCVCCVCVYFCFLDLSRPLCARVPVSALSLSLSLCLCEAEAGKGTHRSLKGRTRTATTTFCDSLLSSCASLVPEAGVVVADEEKNDECEES